MKKVFAGSLVAIVATFGAQALLAQAQPQQSQQLTANRIITLLENAGYTQITDVEKDDGVWEVDAVSPKGERVEIDLDPVSGKIIRERPNDDD
jgi:hypothetical protein